MKLYYCIFALFLLTACEMEAWDTSYPTDPHSYGYDSGMPHLDQTLQHDRILCRNACFAHCNSQKNKAQCRSNCHMRCGVGNYKNHHFQHPNPFSNPYGYPYGSSYNKHFYFHIPEND